MTVNRLRAYFEMSPKAKPVKFTALQERLNDLGLRASLVSKILRIEESRISQFLSMQLPDKITPLFERFCNGIGVIPGELIKGKVVVNPDFDPSSLITPQQKLEALLQDKEHSRTISHILDIAFEQLHSRNSG